MAFPEWPQFLVPGVADAIQTLQCGAMNEREAALLEIGLYLKQICYRFCTITPESHRRVNRRAESREARTLRDVFGWNQPFSRALVPAPILGALERAGMIGTVGGQLRSLVRFTTAGEDLYAHSGFPTSDTNAVFFGPDTYRFLQLLDREVTSARRAVDLGCGSGAGGLSLRSRAAEILLADINPEALFFARINARLSGASQAATVQSDLLSAVEGEIDLVVSNPPYLIDEDSRVYRHGGGSFGEGLAVRIVSESLDRLVAGGKLVLYTGTAIVHGRDTFLEECRPLLESRGAFWHYREIDPDVFGEELDRDVYRTVDRIAVVGLTAIKA